MMTVQSDLNYTCLAVREQYGDRAADLLNQLTGQTVSINRLLLETADRLGMPAHECWHWVQLLTDTRFS